MAEVQGYFKAPEFSLPQNNASFREMESKLNSILITETPVRPESDSDEKVRSCDNEAVSNSRMLVEFYKPQVKIIEDLISHHGDTERALKETRTALQELKKENRELKDNNSELLKQNSELKAENRELQAKVSVLEAKIIDLEAKISELGAKIGELEAKIVELEAKISKLEAENRELEAKNSELEAKKSELERIIKSLQVRIIDVEKITKSLQKRIRDLEDELGATKGELKKKIREYNELEKVHNRDRQVIDELRVELRESNQLKEERIQEADSSRKAREKAEHRAQEYEGQLVKLQAKFDPFFKKSGRSAGKYYIDEIVYGGKTITNQEVIYKLLGFADKGEEFKITTEELGNVDPWPNVKKSFTAVYTIGGKGPYRYINRKENEMAKFDRV